MGTEHLLQHIVEQLIIFKLCNSVEFTNNITVIIYKFIDCCDSWN